MYCFSHTNLDVEDVKWLEFFSDPTQWWDNRAKFRRRKNYPDFKHVRTGQCLFIKQSPPWAHAKLKSLKAARTSSRPLRAQYLDIGNQSSNSFLNLDSVQRQRSVPKPTLSDVLHALKECTDSGDVVRGMEVHSQAATAGFCSNNGVVTSLIKMYGRCGRMDHALEVFDRMLHHDVFSWTALIKGYMENGESERALEMFSGMENARGGCAPNSETYVVALLACTALVSTGDGDDEKRRWLDRGKRIHSQAVTSWCCNVQVENAALKLYAKAGDMRLARGMFDNMKRRDSVSWATVLGGHVENGESEEALVLFDRMEHSDRFGGFEILSIAMRACGALGNRRHGDTTKWYEKGRAIHLRALKERFFNVEVQRAAVEMYAKCGRMSEAWTVFNSMANVDVNSWNTLLEGHIEDGECELALKLFYLTEERSRGTCVANARTYTLGLSACSCLIVRERDKEKRRMWLETGKSIYSQALGNRCATTFLESAFTKLLRMAAEDLSPR